MTSCVGTFIIKYRIKVRESERRKQHGILEKFEEVYQVLEAQKEKDETAAELYADVKEFAYKYATMRYRFSEMSREEKAENDSYRTSQHNRFMDSVRIYFRYLQNNGVNVPDISKLEADRKIFGNFACYYIFRIECEQA